MSNDEKQKGPLEAEVEALRAMLEQRSRESHPGGPDRDEGPLSDTPGEKPRSVEEKSRSADEIAEEIE